MAKGKQRPGRTSDTNYLNHLSGAVLTGETPTPTLLFWVCVAAFASACDNMDYFSVCPPAGCTVFLTLTFMPVFIVFASLKHSWFQWGLELGRFSLELLTGGVAGIPGLQPGCPRSIPEQRIKTSLQVIAHCCLSKVTWTLMALVLLPLGVTAEMLRASTFSSVKWDGRRTSFVGSYMKPVRQGARDTGRHPAQHLEARRL